MSNIRKSRPTGCCALALASALVGGAAMAQTAKALHVVAQYDTAPDASPLSTSPAPLQILLRYAEAASQEQGHRSVRVLSDLGRPGRFEVLEVWSSKAAWEAHKKAPSTATLTDGIGSSLVGPIEEIVLTRFK